MIKTMTKILDKTNNVEYDKIVDRYNQLEKRFDALLTLLSEVVDEYNLNFKGMFCKSQNLLKQARHG